MEKASAKDALNAAVERGAGAAEKGEAHGVYVFECYGPDGKLKWRDTIDNVITTVGKNLMLDTALAGSAYTVVGPYLGLISNVSYTTGPAAGDTMSSHGGWTEAGNANNPTWSSGVRATAAFSAASGGAKALSSAASFSINSTGPDTVKGAFMVYGTGAVSTIDNTAGTLLSGGLFSGGDKSVSNGDTLNVSWSMSI